MANQDNVETQDTDRSSPSSEAEDASARDEAAAANGAEQDPPAQEKAAAAEDAEPEDPETDDSEAESPEAQVEALKEERDELNDRLLRQAAEFQNFRRRMEREKERTFDAGKKEVILPMLEVLDDFQRSLEAAEELEDAKDKEAAYEQLKSGVEMIFKKFLDELGNLGVEPIDAKGKPFNENEHEAMMQQPAPDDVEEGTVLEEIRKGYRMDDQVLRHSRVIVAS